MSDVFQVWNNTKSKRSITMQQIHVGLFPNPRRKVLIYVSNLGKHFEKPQWKSLFPSISWVSEKPQGWKTGGWGT